MFGRLLCRVGLHRYEWRTQSLKMNEDAGGMDVLRDQYRCTRPGCVRGKHWITANIEARKPW